MGVRGVFVLLVAALALVSLTSVGVCGEAGTGTRMKALMHGMQDPDPLVRQAAARGLGELGDNSALPALTDVLSTDPDESVRLAALGALRSIGDGVSPKAYRKALGDRSEKVRRGAADALSGIWDDEAAGALMDVLKYDQSPKVRRVAAEALGRPGPRAKGADDKGSRADDIEAALISVLKTDASYEVRAQAASELAKFKEGGGALAPLEEAVGKDSSPAVRAAAAESLGEFDAKGAVDRLLEVLTFEKDDSVLVNALRALKSCDDTRLPPLVVDALGSASSKVRWEAIDMVEAGRIKSAVGVLKDIAHDKYESDGIRAKAKEALEMMGEK